MSRGLEEARAAHNAAPQSAERSSVVRGVPDTGASTAQTTARIEALIAEHTRTTWADWPFTCTCEPDVHNSTMTYAAHLAATLASTLDGGLAGKVREVEPLPDALLGPALDAAEKALGYPPTETSIKVIDAALRALLGVTTSEGRSSDPSTFASDKSNGGEPR